MPGERGGNTIRDLGPGQHRKAVYAPQLLLAVSGQRATSHSGVGQERKRHFWERYAMFASLPREPTHVACRCQPTTATAAPPGGRLERYSQNSRTFHKQVLPGPKRGKLLSRSHRLLDLFVGAESTSAPALKPAWAVFPERWVLRRDSSSVNLARAGQVP